jgi:hypothetical protein
MPIDRARVARAQSSSPRSEMSTVLMMGIVLIAASVVVLVWAFPTRR